MSEQEVYNWDDLLIDPPSVPQPKVEKPKPEPKKEKVPAEKKENPKDVEIAELKRRLKSLDAAKERMNAHLLTADETIESLQIEISQLKASRQSGPCEECSRLELDSDRLRRELEGERRISDELRIQLSNLELSPERRILLIEVFKSYWSKWKNKGNSDRKARFHLIRQVMGFTIEELEEVPQESITSADLIDIE